ncbi:MAG: hypothetical protein ACTTHL_00160 [Oribacterium sp.]
MSAFLGPIHYWLYGKIRIQEEMIRSAAACGEAQGWQELTEALRAETVSGELRPLEELIDTANIHGWLQDRIHDAEGRYARLVTALLTGHAERMQELKSTLYRLGEAHGVAADADARDAYQAFEDSLLNGMPCDRVNVLTEQETGRCSWRQTSDIHGQYWAAAGGDAAVYYVLRTAFMEGMLSRSGLRLTEAEDFAYTVTAERQDVKDL